MRLIQKILIRFQIANWSGIIGGHQLEYVVALGLPPSRFRYKWKASFNYSDNKGETASSKINMKGSELNIYFYHSFMD